MRALLQRSISVPVVRVAQKVTTTREQLRPVQFFIVPGGNEAGSAFRRRQTRA